MPLSQFSTHDQRFELSNELHARPFPEIETPAQAICLAFKGKAGGDPVADRAQLDDLLHRFGATMPKDGANHYYGPLGNRMLKWERHTEFVTYTIISSGHPDRPFDLPSDLLPQEWSEAMPGKLLTATVVFIDEISSEDQLKDVVTSRIAPHLVHESTAMSMVLDSNALVAGDFRIDANGFNRFAVLAAPGTGRRRLGRITQRLMEIENYKSMSMLTLPVARAASRDLSALDQRLSDIVQRFAEESNNHEASLAELLDISAQIEHLVAKNAHRFSAAEAYSAIVTQRIEVLRETRFEGRQTFGEFMMRRYDPAIRTCASVAERVRAVADRTARAGDMLRTRTDVAQAKQNQDILKRMDERAAQQLRLQETVEGLSVVAVSYYAVNLAAYFLAPAAEPLGMQKIWLTALLVPPVLLAVWWMIRRIRKKL